MKIGLLLNLLSILFDEESDIYYVIKVVFFRRYEV